MLLWEMRVLTATFVFLCATPAIGFPTFVPRIPNVANRELGLDGIACGVCHEDRFGGGEVNSFGQDFDAFREWPMLYDLDSDRDGQTNGLELGDPNGVWRPGDTPERTVDLSLPGDRSSKSFDDPPEVDAGFSEPEAGVEPDVGVGPTDQGLSKDSGSFDSALPENDVGIDAGFPDVGFAASEAPDYPEVICTCARTHSTGPDHRVWVLVALLCGARWMIKHRTHRST